MNKWDEFSSRWAAEFKNLTRSDGVEYWQEFIFESDPILIQQSINLLIKDADFRESQGIVLKNPKLRNLKAVYFKLKDAEKWNGISISGECLCCGNSGWVVIVCDLSYRKILNPKSPIPVLAGRFAGPCGNCDRGLENKKEYSHGYKNECVNKRFGPVNDFSAILAAEKFIQDCENLL